MPLPRQLIEEVFNWELDYSFRGWIHDRQDLKQGSKEVDMVLKRQLRAYIGSIGTGGELV